MIDYIKCQNCHRCQPLDFDIAPLRLHLVECWWCGTPMVVEGYAKPGGALLPCCSWECEREKEGHYL